MLRLLADRKTGAHFLGASTVSKVIYINGASSSGKTTLAKRIQNSLASPIFYYSIDTLLETMPADELARLRESSRTKLINWDCLFAGYFRSAASLSEAGLDIILDCPLYDGRVALYNENIVRLEPVTILLTCPLEELRRRELNRGDRWVGLADFQAPRVLKSIEHRFVFDAAADSAEKMCDQILVEL